MELRLLRYFLTVAKEQSFKKQQNNCILPSQRFPDKWRHLKRTWE